jgi:hypothetical protein
MHALTMADFAVDPPRSYIRLFFIEKYFKVTSGIAS